jgi:hypothetical protein
MDVPLDPPCADEAPAGPSLTEYETRHFVTYLRMLDADREGADWREVSKIVLHIDPDADASRARGAYESHMSRARWMTEQGYRRLFLGTA